MKLTHGKNGQPFSTAERLMILGLGVGVLLALALMGWRLLDMRGADAAAFESSIGDMSESGF